VGTIGIKPIREVRYIETNPVVPVAIASAIARLFVLPGLFFGATLMEKKRRSISIPWVKEKRILKGKKLSVKYSGELRL
jgi:hypothetical protein